MKKKQEDGAEMIYLLENSDGLTETFLLQGLPLLSRQRRDRILRYGSLQDRINGCAAYLLLRYGLWQEYQIRTAPAFIFGEHEKPFLADYPDIYFNLSHCKTAIACIIAPQETAIDVTDRRKIKNNLTRRVCSPEEQRQLSVSEDPETCFLRMWTRKECLSKLTGEGMSRSFRTITDEWPQAVYVHTEERPCCILSYYAEAPQTIRSLTAQTLWDTLSENNT